MAARSELLQPTSNDLVDWTLRRISAWTADMSARRRRNAGNRAIRILGERQLRDVGIDAIYESQRKEAAANAVLLANLLSLR